MARGEANQTKVHFKGKEDDFIVFVDDVAELNKWKSDKSTPLANFVGSFKIFVSHKYATPHSSLSLITPPWGLMPLAIQDKIKAIELWCLLGHRLMCSNRHGAQGELDGASKSTLENEFGTSKEDDVIVQILEKGTAQESQVRLPILQPPSFPPPTHHSLRLPILI